MEFVGHEMDFNKSLWNEIDIWLSLTAQKGQKSNYFTNPLRHFISFIGCLNCNQEFLKWFYKWRKQRWSLVFNEKRKWVEHSFFWCFKTFVFWASPSNTKVVNVATITAATNGIWKLDFMPFMVSVLKAILALNCVFINLAVPAFPSDIPLM